MFFVGFIRGGDQPPFFLPIFTAAGTKNRAPERPGGTSYNQENQ